MRLVCHDLRSLENACSPKVLSPEFERAKQYPVYRPFCLWRFYSNLWLARAAHAGGVSDDSISINGQLSSSSRHVGKLIGISYYSLPEALHVYRHEVNMPTNCKLGDYV